MQQSMNGTTAVLSILSRLVNSLVSVREATRLELPLIGLVLSPKKHPLITAPPTSAGFAPMAFPIVMQITPIVALVAKAEPVISPIAQLSRKVRMINVEG